MFSTEKDGWRIHLVEDSVAIDNRPLWEEAKEKGEILPEPVSVVIPAEVILEAWDLL